MTSQIYFERNNPDKNNTKTGEDDNLFLLVSVSLLLAEVRSRFCFVWIRIRMIEASGKLKRVVLTIEDKLNICKLVKQKVSKTITMSNYNIGKSTYNDICRKEADL